MMEIFGVVFWLGVLYWLWKVLFTPAPRSARRVTLPLFVTEEYIHPTSTVQPRELVIFATDPHSHPYQEHSLDNLLTHLNDQHWEVMNSLVERDPAPRTWRREHASDHGLVAR